MDLLCEYYRMINEPDYLLEKVAERVFAKENIGFSFEFHPLGFVSIGLTNNNLKSNICINFSENINITPIHNHHFDMLSTILVGELENHIIEFVVTRNIEEYRKYQICYDAENKRRYLTEIEGSYRIINQKSFLYKKLDSYFMKAGEYHISKHLSNQPLVTLLLKNKIIEKSYCMYKQWDFRKQEILCEKELSFDEKEQFLLSFQRILNI